MFNHTLCTQKPSRVTQKPVNWTSAIICFSLIVSLVQVPAQAAAGDLDPGFHNDGKTTTDFFGEADVAFDMVVQPDGRIVVVGATLGEVDRSDFALVRYNADGSLDATFGNGGRVETNFTGHFDQAEGVALDASGRIIAVGISANDMGVGDFALARYNADGSLDASFGNGGKVTTDFFGFTDGATDVAVQPDGKIIVSGAAIGLNEDFVLALAAVRYNADGSLDQTFATGGKFTTAGGVAEAMTLQPDGKIILAGMALIGGAQNFTAVRLNIDGTPDAQFGTGGQVITDFFGSSDLAFSVALQLDGKVVVAGHANNPNSGAGEAFARARYSVEGMLDPGFDVDGRVTTDSFSQFESVNDIAIQADGRIIAAGFTTNDADNTGRDFALARYNIDGGLDVTFNGDGKLTTDFNKGFDSATSVAIQPDGRIVVAGFAQNSGADDDFALARYNAVTAPDFALSFPASMVKIDRGRKKTVVVNIVSIDGFVGPVTVTAPDLTALKINISPASHLVDDGRAKFKVKVKSQAAVATHRLVFTGRDASGRERIASIPLVVR